MAPFSCSLQTPTQISGSPTHPLEPNSPIASPTLSLLATSHVPSFTLKRLLPLLLPSTLPISHLLGTSHMIYPRVQSPDGRWKGVGAPEEPFLFPSLFSCPDWDTVQNLKHLEETAARNGMEGPGLEKGAKTPGFCPPSATDHCGMREDRASVSPKELRVSLCFPPPWVGEKPINSWRGERWEAPDGML